VFVLLGGGVGWCSFFRGTLVVLGFRGLSVLLVGGCVFSVGGVCLLFGFVFFFFFSFFGGRCYLVVLWCRFNMGFWVRYVVFGGGGVLFRTPFALVTLFLFVLLSFFFFIFL